MADAKVLPNLQALSRSPSPAQTLPSEAVLDALQMMLSGASLNEVLTSITLVIEAHSEGMLCSIFLLDEDGLHLRYGVAAKLPEAYRAATDGVCIGPNVGSCGAAAYLRQPVFVSDILSHPNWAKFRGVVTQSGLRAAWSTPIMSHDGNVLGTFCMYYREVRHPGTDDIQLIDYASRIAGIAIERERSRSALKKPLVEIRYSENRLRTIIDTIPGFVCTLSAAGEVELLNRQVLEYFGKTSQQHVPAGETTFRVSRGESARLEPSVHAIGTPLAELKIMRLPGFDRVSPRVDYARKVIRMDSVGRGPILQLLTFLRIASVEELTSALHFSEPSGFLKGRQFSAR